MNKIFDWLFGGIFRTLGRLIGFVIFGGIIAVLLLLNNVKITDLLGIDYVNAAVIENWSVNQVKIRTDVQGTNTWSNNYTGNHTFTGSDLNYPVNAIEWRLKATDGLSVENTYTFSYSFKPTPDAVAVTNNFMRRNVDSENENILCNENRTNDGYYVYNCTLNVSSDYTSDEYLYVRLTLTQGYLTDLKTKITGYEERKGTNAVITEQTNNIIENNNENTTNIINNNNQNTQQIIESNQSCSILDRNNAKTDGEHQKFTSNCEIAFGNQNQRVSDYYSLQGVDHITLVTGGSGYYIAFYSSDKSLISCMNNSNTGNGEQIEIPGNAVYFRFSYSTSSSYNTMNVCKKGNQAVQDAISQSAEQTQQALDELRQQQSEEQQVCNVKVLKYTDKVTDGYISASNGYISSASNWGVTDYLEINKLEILSSFASEYTFSCFYNDNKVLISCIPASTSTGLFELPTNTKYARFSIRQNDVPEYKVSLCKNGNQAVNDNMLDLIHDINKTDTDEALSFYEDLFNNFTENNHGIAGIISAPLEMIANISSGTCTPVVVGGGSGEFEGVSFELPCLTPLYEQWFPDFLELYQTITLGLISYWIVVDIFRWLKSFRNPNDDRIEVADL